MMQAGLARARVATLSRQIRLRHWAHFLALPLAGVDARLPLGLTLVALARGVTIAFAVLAFGYLLNSLTDRHMDLDPDKRVTPRRGHRVAIAALAFLALLLASTAAWPVLIATAACLLCGWIYSAGPRLKALPWIGSLLNVGNFAPLLAVGLARDDAPPALFALAWSFAALLLQNQLLHEAADAREDARGGVRTTFVTLGPRRTATIALACGLALVAAVGACGVAPGGLVLAALVAGPFAALFPWLLLTRGAHATTMRRVRVAHRWAALATGALLYALWALA